MKKYIVWIRRNIGGVEVDEDKEFEAEDDRDLRRRLHKYYKDFWGPGTVCEEFGFYERSDGTEALRIKGWREAPTSMRGIARF